MLFLSLYYACHFKGGDVKNGGYSMLDIFISVSAKVLDMIFKNILNVLKS